MVRILDHKILYGEQRFHAAFPSIARFSDGNLVLAFRRARDGMWLIPQERRKTLDPLNRMDHIDSRSHIMLMTLDAEGKPVQESLDMLPVDPEAGDQDPSLLVLPDDRLFLASFSWYPLPADAAQHISGRIPPGDNYPGCRFLFWGAHTSLRERQAGKWLASHRYIQPDGGFGYPLSPGGEKQIAGSVRGQPLFKNDQVLLALYGGKGNATALFVSNDAGNSWQFLSTIAHDPEGKIAFQEPALCHDGHAGIVCFMRTAGANGRLASCHSKDGVHWSEPHLHRLIGHPFNPLVLKDGRILLSYGYRVNPYGIRARLLSSALQDPDEAEEIIIRDDGLCADLGYPWGVELDNGQVLLVYYMTNDQGMRYIAGSWLEI